MNLLLELLIGLGQHEEALHVLCQHSGVGFSSDTVDREDAEQMGPEQQLKAFSSVSFDQSGRTGQQIPPDIKSKLLVVLINLKATHLTKARQLITLSFNHVS